MVLDRKCEEIFIFFTQRSQNCLLHNLKWTKKNRQPDFLNLKIAVYERKKPIIYDRVIT